MTPRGSCLRIGLSGLLLATALAGCGRYGKPERYPTTPPAPPPSQSGQPPSQSRLETHAPGAEKRYTLVDREPLRRVPGVCPASGC